MITLENRYGILTDKMVLYPNEAEIATLTKAQPLTCLVRVRHSTVEVPDSNRHLVYRETMTTSCVDLRKSTEDLYQDMDAKSCRYEIRKAQKMADSFQVRMNEEAVRKDFFMLYNDFVVRKGHARPLSEQRYSKYLSMGDVFVVYFKDRPVCGHVLLPDPSVKRVRLLFSASSRLNSKEDATIVSPLNRYLHWYEFQKYKADGFENYDFGGITVGGSISKFKMSFGGTLVKERGYVLAGGFSAGLLKVGYKQFLWLLRQHAAFVTSLKRWQSSAMGKM